MKDNTKNFREASDVILKNIYVTDELKRRTLEKCTNRKGFVIKPILTATFSAALMCFLAIFIYFFHKPAVIDNPIAKSIDQEYKNSSNNEDKIQKTPKTASSNDSDRSHAAASDNKNNAKNNTPVPEKKNKDIAMKDSNNIPQSKSIDTVNKNTETASQSKNDSYKPSYNVPQDSAYISNNKSISNSDSNSNSETSLVPQAQLSLASVPEPLTIESAEKYFESKILLPSYIPEGFKLADVSIPDDKQKCIKLKYSSDSAYFEILQSKNLSKLEGTKNISIGNNTAYINSIKDEGTNTITTSITWIGDGIQYSLSSSLSEDSLIKIANSIN
jgi:hypothetical protein